MASELQRIVDSIARRLQRAAAIDDARMRLQVYSPHYGPVDQTRLDSILHREAPKEVTDWVLSLGHAEDDKPFRLPTDPDKGMFSRVGASIRCQDVHLGWLWLIDAEETLNDDEDLTEFQAAADAAGVVMYRERLLAELERGQQREITRDLLTGDAAERRVAAARAREDRLFIDPAALVVVGTIIPEEGPPSDPHRVALEHALGVCRRTLEPGRALPLARADHGVLVVSPKEPQVVRKGARAVADLLRREVASYLGPTNSRLVIGIGGVSEELELVAESYDQAREALRVAEIVGSFGDTAEWGHLGVYGLLLRLPQQQLTAELLHPGLRALLEAADDRTLVHTLEAYLDTAGDAKATAAELVIHRTSLYYRLRRIQEISGTDLNIGDDRLALHLGLKIARLAGLLG